MIEIAAVAALVALAVLFLAGATLVGVAALAAAVWVADAVGVLAPFTDWLAASVMRRRAAAAAGVTSDGKILPAEEAEAHEAALFMARAEGYE